MASSVVRTGALLLVAALWLSGCVQEGSAQVDNPLTAEQRAEYYIQTVEISIHPNAILSWETAHAQLAEDAGVDPDDPLAVARFADSPEGDAALRALLEQRMRDVLVPKLETVLGTGEKPAFLAVQAASLNIIPPGQQIVLGAGVHGIGGGLQVYDLETGERLTRAQIMAGGAAASSGIGGVMRDQSLGDPLGRVLDAFAVFSVAWLSATHPIKLPWPNVNNEFPDLPGPKGS
ncbi:MAG: hypothetical protein AAF409_06395 [Pseudomonadota bacterium]